MPPKKRGADDITEWAAARAPELLARAEAEAVAVLRDALVTAATAQRREADRPPRAVEPPRPARSADAGDLLWAYCVLRAADRRPADLTGVVPGVQVEAVEAGGLVALVSKVPRAEFGAEPLRRNLNDIAWLERVARAHEAVLEQTLGVATLVPLRLCTLFEDRKSVRRMLESERGVMVDALDSLEGRQEWGVKLIVDPERLEEQARARLGDAGGATETGGGAGGSYMQRRRQDRQVREAARNLMAALVDDVRSSLEATALEVVTQPPQNRDLSGHQGEMLVNAACLVDSNRVDALRQLAATLEQGHRDLGARVEVTGPWPPYNFVSHGGTPALA